MPRKGLAFKSEVEQLANTAVSSVASQQIWRRAALLSAVPMFQGQLDAIAGIAEADEFDTALDCDPEFRELFSHDPLGLGLIEGHDEIILALQSVESQPQKPSRAMIEVCPMGLVAELEDRPRNPALLEQFQRAGLDCDGAGMGLRFRQSVDDSARHPKASKIHGRGKPCRPGADHHHRRGGVLIPIEIRHGRAPIGSALVDTGGSRVCGWQCRPNA